MGPEPLEGGTIADRLEAVRSRLSDLGAGDVVLVGVTKGADVGSVRQLLAGGLVDLGESYADELVGKAAALGAAQPGPRWHYLGRLQRRKVRKVAHLVSLWQSIDRAELAAEVARRCPGAAALVQVNLSGEPQRGGCSWDEVGPLVDVAAELGLHVEGLMGIAPAGPAELARPGFSKLVATADRLGLPIRSIGMSGDFEVAVAEGATMLRLGRALLGH